MRQRIFYYSRCFKLEKWTILTSFGGKRRKSVLFFRNWLIYDDFQRNMRVKFWLVFYSRKVLITESAIPFGIADFVSIRWICEKTDRAGKNSQILAGSM